MRGKHRNCRRADPVQVETLTTQQVSRAQHLPAIRTQWEKATPGWHGLRYAAPSYMPYYNRASVLTCAASGRDGGIWYALKALRRCDTLQRGAGDIIAVCVGLVSLAVERAQSQEKPLQSPVRCFVECAVINAWT